MTDEVVVLIVFADPESSGTDQTCALQLLSQLPNPAAIKDEDGRTLLHFACRNYWDEVAKKLMELHIQCQIMDPAIVILTFMYPSTTGTDQARAFQLLSKLPNAASVRDENDRSLLHHTCWNKWDDASKLLIEEHGMDSEFHCFLLEAFMDNESPDQTRALELLSLLPNVAAVRDKNGNTLLHWACWHGWYDVVKVLVESVGCDIYHQISFLSALKNKCYFDDLGTPLHWACFAGHLNIVKYLIIEKGCDPELRNAFKCTPLHCACAEGNLDVVKFLMTEMHCDPLKPITKFMLNFKLTPLHLAYINGHLDVVDFLLSSGKADKLPNQHTFINPLVKIVFNQIYPQVGTFDTREIDPGNGFHDDSDYISIHRNELFSKFFDCRKRDPFYPAFKTFVMGNSSVGKSTLIKGIQSKMTATRHLPRLTARSRRVSGVEPWTAGIIPVTIESKKRGNIIMYDLAGHYQYYSSHAALLEQLVSSPGALLMVVVNLSESDEEIVQTLQYWNSFIENHCNQVGSSSEPNILFVGSHADVAKAAQQDPTQKSAIISSRLRVSEIIPIDCTQLASDGLTRICHQIVRNCSEFHQKFAEIDLQVHFLYAVLAKEFKCRTAIQVSEILPRIAREETQLQLPASRFAEHNKHDRSIALLPQDTPALSKHLTTLNAKGHFVYLKNEQNIEDSWVILDQEVLLSDINGTIFAPEIFKEYHDISSSTGVVPFSKIKEVFPSHNPEMIISFMSHLEFCQQIAESEASLISEDRLGGSRQLSETFYFFPALVSKDRPKQSCKLFIKETHYKCGWSLQCIRPDQFLSSRFLHVLLLRLAFSFALGPETSEEDEASPVLQRRCNVWKAGIHWQNRDGVETIVEVVEQNTVVIVQMGCLKRREVACVGLRSEVIRTILDAKERFCGAVRLRESLIHPAELSSYSLNSPKLLPSFTITELATTIAEGKEVVTRKQGQCQQMLEINELLYFEPYACFNPALLEELFDEENAEREIPVRFLSAIGETTHPKKNEFMTALGISLRSLQTTIDKAPPSRRDNPAHISTLMFRAWKASNPTSAYQALRSALDRFSVFCGRNPLVSVLCILCVLTIWPGHASV